MFGNLLSSLYDKYVMKGNLWCGTIEMNIEMFPENWLH